MSAVLEAASSSREMSFTRFFPPANYSRSRLDRRLTDRQTDRQPPIQSVRRRSWETAGQPTNEGLQRVVNDCRLCQDTASAERLCRASMPSVVTVGPFGSRRVTYSSCSYVSIRTASEPSIPRSTHLACKSDRLRASKRSLLTIPLPLVGHRHCSFRSLPRNMAHCE